jgi:hypothetical protein
MFALPPYIVWIIQEYYLNNVASNIRSSQLHHFKTLQFVAILLVSNHKFCLLPCFVLLNVDIVKRFNVYAKMSKKSNTRCSKL